MPSKIGALLTAVQLSSIVKLALFNGMYFLSKSKLKSHPCDLPVPRKCKMDGEGSSSL